ncbi:hypothetical protein [Streptomyces sp. NPDC047525]|uniref:hypothetical protein n=1 Tax=Streptomyces sp. NPDC047525 TaxID=3155264 RepID=UPI003400B068
MTDPVEVWRAPKLKSAYTSRPDWDQAVRVWVGVASVQPDRAYESYSPERDQSQERLSVFLPFEAVITSGDRVKLGGFMYDVDGEPERWAYTSRRHVRLSAWRALR